MLAMQAWIAPTSHIFNYWATDRTKRPALLRYIIGFLGLLSFYFFGPLAMHKDITGPNKDPFDMTEAWKDYEVRKEYALELAKKDQNQDGVVELEELKEVELQGGFDYKKSFQY